MQIKDFLTNYQHTVTPHYREFFKFWIDESIKAGQLPREMFDKFVDIYPRGKQLRGALAVLGYQLAGGQNLQEMLKASITLELLETSVLIADDIFDRDQIRRGVPTIHKQWEHQLAQATNTDSIELARNLTMITTMNGYYLATHNLSRTQLPPQLIQKALEFYSYSSILTGMGEAMDIYTVTQNFNQKKTSISVIHQYKTIWYSAILPFKFGAILARADSKTLAKIHQFAQITGSIFQIQDDILGSFGDPATTGKANTQDLCEARWTILIELLFNDLKSKQNAKVSADFQLLSTLLNQKERSDVDIQSLKDLMIEYAIIDKAKQTAHVLLEQGLKLIPTVTKASDHQDTLKNILYFVLERQK